MDRQYTKEELSKLHEVLYEVLAEVIRVCDKLGIEYFVQGGSGIGVHFYQSIIPWDDDIDVGMTRDNYNRFLKEAPAVLKPEYFLAWFGSDPHTPFYFAKVRKNNTTFLEEACQGLDMHQGIYVDIFPFDKLPQNPRAEFIQRRLCCRLSECLSSKEVWTWKYWGKCKIEKPNVKGFWECLATRLVVTFLSKSLIYRLLCQLQTMYNNSDAKYYNIILTSVDQIPVEDVHNTQWGRLGPLDVKVPNHLEDYLKHHYKGLSRDVPKEKQVNHAPVKLSFQ